MQLRNINKKFSLKSLTFITVVAGSLLSTAVIADQTSSDYMQIAASSMNSGDQNGRTAKLQQLKDDDSEIGSTYVLDVSSKLGAFSREDGSRMRAYGDGEFAD